MASLDPMSTITVHNSFQNVSASSHVQFQPAPFLEFTEDDWNLLNTDLARFRKPQIRHPSQCWCTGPEYISTRQLAVPSPLASFDASGWSFIPETDMRNMSSWNKCHLLSLPKELRLEIWKYVLTDPSVSELAVEITREQISPSRSSIRFPTPCIKTTLEPPRNSPINLSLLRANRFIYEEALPVLYKSVKFTPIDLEGIFPLFLDSLSLDALPLIRHVKLRIHPSLYDGDLFCDTSSTLFHWAITCAQVAKLDALRDVEIEGLFSTFASKRIIRGLLYPLCKIKAKKIMGQNNGDDAKELLAEARKELQAQAQVRSERTKAEAAARARRETCPREHAGRQEVEQQHICSFPSTCNTTIDSDISQLAGIKQFEKELEEHAKTGDEPTVMFEGREEEDVDTQIGDWDLITLGSGASTPKVRPASVMSDFSDESWTDTASTIAGLEDPSKVHTTHAIGKHKDGDH